MVFKSYSIEYSPSPKDKNRYKLNLSCSEDDVNQLVKRLKNISSRPFHSPDKDYDWALFLYNVSDAFKNKLEAELKKVMGSKLKPEITAPESESNADAESGETEGIAKPPADGDISESVKLYNEYTFSNFIVGANTRFTYAACKAVAENPGKNYNPLFIYGGVGLGKTHLMQAIGNYVLDKAPDLKVLYLTTEIFVREVIDAIERGDINSLRKKYTQIDLLLIDDIQFLEKSESTQEEFFHIFNEMHEYEKQIVITSDKPPKKLSTLEERLKSRFEWGLTTDIKSPNIETRKAILKRKSEKAGLAIPDDISNYVAERLTSNIRELEGIINRIGAYKQLSEDDITFDLVKDIIKNLLPTEDKEEDEPKNTDTDVKGPEAQAVSSSPHQNVFPPPPAPQYHAPVYPPPPQYMGNRCSRCGGQITYVPQYQRWYCMNCSSYTEPAQNYGPVFQPPPQNMPPPEAVKKCSECGGVMRYIEQYGKFYCQNCGKYEEEDDLQENKETPAAKKTEKKEEKSDSSSKSKAAEPEPKEKVSEDLEEKVLGEERKGVREIRVGYFLPEGSRDIFAKIIGKLDKLAVQKKFNFYIRPLFVHDFDAKLAINYDKIAHLSQTNDIDIALCILPDKKSGVNPSVFREKLSESMEKIDMPFEVLPQEEIKESDALNLMLDIAICARKK